MWTTPIPSNDLVACSIACSLSSRIWIEPDSGLVHGAIQNGSMGSKGSCTTSGKVSFRLFNGDLFFQFRMGRC
ncbi:hypothetical protein VTN77DRAFT_7423 [Rasamsonia byssochlamydoides]|uniref:uncharacterized protein n=1 Tax=Rasamsonia byssochlamydoides TaxID=89139 RepID=UPI00374432A1